MRILQCHIENFGKLKDLTLDFTDNPYLVYENNGWGKSTLAAFIKVMFYGFTNEGKRSEIENERKRYRPWQGGVYGGEITIELSGKTYRFTRTFGQKEKEDTFALYDTATNLAVEDYSAEIGAELFQIDRESFSRTIFIGQSDIVTKATDSINAKIGNLAENTDDINNYDTVQEKLKKLCNNMSPTRITGSIRKKKDEVTRLEKNISRAGHIDQSLAELEDLLRVARDTKTQLKAEQSAIHRKMEQVSSIKDLQSKKDAYDRICTELNRAVDEVTEERQYFPAAVPTESELTEILAEADKLTGYQRELQILQLQEAEQQSKAYLGQLFHDGVPEPEEILEYRNKIAEYSDLHLEIAGKRISVEDKNRLTELNRRFSSGLPEADMLNQLIGLWNQRTTAKSELAANKATLKTLRTMQEQPMPQMTQQQTTKPNRQKQTILLGLGLLLLFIGILGMAGVSLSFIPGILCLGAGIVLVIVSLLTRPTESPQTVSQSEEGRGQTAAAAEPWSELERQIARDEAWIQKMAADIQSFFGQYGIPFAESDVLSQLYGLREQVQDYHNLTAREQKYQLAGLDEKSRIIESEIRLFLQQYDPHTEIATDHFSARLQKLEEQRQEYNRLLSQDSKYHQARIQYDSTVQRIWDFIRILGFQTEENLGAQLQKIRDHLGSLMAAQKRAAEKQEEKEQFERTEDVGRYRQLEADENLPALEELNRQTTEITSQLEQLDHKITSYNQQADQKTTERERLDEDEAQCRMLKEELADDLHQYQIIMKTRDYLEKAKERFTARYIGPVMSGFEKYHQLLSGEEAERYVIDANINVTAKELGEQRNPKLLSTGYQDLIGLCMRMALVDAMFQGEKPFIIFDDSFTNLDNDKTARALRFLTEVAAEYQVIYFTCHDSRV